MAARPRLAPPPATTTPRPSFTIQEVADLLRITERSVRRYIADGRIRAVPVGKWVRIPAEEVDRLMAEGV